MFKESIKPNRKNILLSFLIIIFALGIGFLMFILGAPIPKGLEILKIIGLPFQIFSLISLPPMFIFPLLIVTIFWIYLIACLLLCLKEKITATEWGAKKLIILALIIILCSAAYGFLNLGWGDIFVRTANDDGATIQGVNDIANANNRFAIKLFNEINKKSKENIFFSPWSISTAAAMAYEGARGETADEIQSVFHFPIDDSSRRSSYARMLNIINKAGGKYKLYTANAIWIQKDYPFLKDYKETINRYYLGEIKNLDFTDNPGGSSSEINSWVSKNTNDKIKDIVSPDMFSHLTRAVLTNAIYFKGKWEHQFDKKYTRPEDFTLKTGRKVKVPMMRLSDNDLKFNYADSDGVQILEMPYKGDKVSMLVLLPRTEISDTGFAGDKILPQLSDIDELQSILSAEKLQEWERKMRPETVYIYMPKYTFETSYSLTDYLKSMGMNLPFIWPGADFSGMDGTEMLYIDQVLHKAYIDVYEEGTEAAAATALVMTLGSAGPRFIEFRADHPFIFIIQERETGNILFMGRVNNPTKK